ncbi:hypothetical protein [Marinobacter fonticola]|uniref:hypothetical protein n=1 Tax=Marinobacter fonticola TaxID=2603215 RepID=UPI0011E67FCE|nr:hypothetical protein [Marinobacter fonticola]
MNEPTPLRPNPCHRRLRADVLDLYNDCIQRSVTSTETAIMRLATLGYRDAYPEPDHWVLTRAGITVHLYGEHELKAFANHLTMLESHKRKPAWVIPNPVATRNLEKTT